MTALIMLIGLLAACVALTWVYTWICIILTGLVWPDGEIGILFVGGWLVIACGVITFFVGFVYLFG
jgi:hypothetical protein